MTTLNYMVTSNHVHLLVADDGGRDVIPNAMKLVAGRTGQEYNQRKNRKGAFWEDRYHATAVQSGDHLARCMIYIDTNMVRAGVASHPSQWAFSGYIEIQAPRRKNVLIDYDRLTGIFGAGSYEELRRSHNGWVSVFSRLIGYQANASSLDQSDLDGAEGLQSDDLSDWGNLMIDLNKKYGIKILGGCCGTSDEYLQFIAQGIQGDQDSNAFC